MSNIYVLNSKNYTTFDSPWEILREVILPNEETFVFLKSPLVTTTVSLVIIAVSIVHHLYTRSWGAIKYTVPIPAECDENWKGEIHEDQRLQDRGTNDIRCYCPANGQFLGKVRAWTAKDVDIAVHKAEAAQKEWACTSFRQRKQVLSTLLRYIIANQDIIARAACMDSGKTKIDAALGEILVTVEKIKWVLRHGEKALKTEKRPVSFLMMYKTAEVRYEPMGVVAACVSWNYPFHNLVNPIISSIFAGNGIIVKGSESTAWSSQFFIQIVKGALIACKQNPDLVESISCWPDVAEHITSHPSIAHITFIGSRAVAKAVARSASRSLPSLCLELGGKDCAVVLDDYTNFAKLTSVLMRGTFQSTGQNCIGIERIIALPKAYDQLILHLEPRIRALRIGSALEDKDVDVGAMISSANFGKLEALIQDAVAHGARLLAGGQKAQHAKYPNGNYFEPTLLVDVTPDMKIAQEECFAPICVMMKAANVTQAIDYANSTEYGLGGSVFGKNGGDLRRVADEMKSGMVAINDFAVFYMVQLPFGGQRGSGYGRFAGEEGIRSVCNLKSICIDRFPLISTSIPPIVDYPIKSAVKSWEFCKGLVELAAGENLEMRSSGIWKLMKNS